MGSEAKDERQAAGRGAFIKFTQEYPDIAEWHRVGLHTMRKPDPAVRLRGEEVSVELFCDAKYAITRLYNQRPVKRALALLIEHERRQYVQDGLDQAVDFHGKQKSEMILNDYYTQLLRGGFDRLSPGQCWLLDTIYRVSMEPGSIGGPRVKIAHDLMVDLIEAGGGPRFSYSTVQRLSKALKVTPHVDVERGYLRLTGEACATRYHLTLEPTPPRIPAQSLTTSQGGDWLYSRSDRTGLLDVAGLLDEAQKADRPTGTVQPLGPDVPRLSVAQMATRERYLRGVSPSKARRMGGQWLTALVSEYIADGALDAEGIPGWGGMADLTEPEPVSTNDEITTEMEQDEMTNATMQECLWGHSEADGMNVKLTSGRSQWVCFRCGLDPIGDTAQWTPQAAESAVAGSGAPVPTPGPESGSQADLGAPGE